MWQHFDRLNRSIEARPAWQEALIVGVAVAITLAGLRLAIGRHPSHALPLGVIGGIGTALGTFIARPLRARHRARRDTS